MISDAPCETEAYDRFASFLGDALSGDTVFCAHNAKFDMAFLSAALVRNGISGKLIFVDTLQLARKFVPGLENYKQDTVASHFKFYNRDSHRAANDALICGKILRELLCLSASSSQKSHASSSSQNSDSYTPKPLSPEENEIAAVFYDIISKNNNTEFIRFKKQTDGISVCCGGYTACKFRVTAKHGTYLLVNSSLVPQLTLRIDDSSASEGGDSFKRVYFESPDDLHQLAKIIDYDYKQAAQNRETALKYYPDSDSWALKNLIELEPAAIDQLITDAHSRYETKKASDLEAQRIAEEKKAESERKKELKEMKAAEKAAKEREKAEREELGLPSVTPRSKEILQLTDDGNVVCEFASLAEAVRATGINSKSIRDAACGKQKHAGGYVWRYKEIDKIDDT